MNINQTDEIYEAEEIDEIEENDSGDADDLVVNLNFYFMIVAFKIAFYIYLIQTPRKQRKGKPIPHQPR